MLREGIPSSTVSSYSTSSRNPCLENCGEVRGLCVGLDVSLPEVVGVGLITCEEVGVIKRVHTLFGGVHRLATALKEVEEVREEAQGIKDE